MDIEELDGIDMPYDIDDDGNTHISTYIKCIKGYPTSDTANIVDLYGAVLDDTQLLVSKLDDGSDELYNDAKVGLGTLSGRLYDDVPKTAMMAYDTYQLATASHTHDKYTWMKVWPDFGPNGKRKEVDVSALLAEIHFKNDAVQNDIQIWLPKIVFPEETIRPKHLIGELMYVAADNYSSLTAQVGNVTDANVSSFSGWVFPYGQTIYTKRFEFMDAKQAFGQQATDTSFTVPDLTGFLMPAASDHAGYGKHILQKTPGYNSVPVHAHASIAQSNPVKLVQTNTQTIPIMNGNGSLYGQTIPPERAETVLPGTRAIICPWNEADANAAPNELPSIRPAGCKELTESEASQMFDLKYDEDQLRKTISNVKFKVEGLELEKAGTQYQSYDEKSTMSYPENVFIPLLIYIGFPYNSKYTYWE